LKCITFVYKKLFVLNLLVLNAMCLALFGNELFHELLEVLTHFRVLTQSKP